MGNASSDAAEAAAMARVATLRDELADMERAVRALHADPAEPLGAHQARVGGGHVVACDARVRVLLGPVVGRVDAHSARVLLEVDRAAVLSAHVLVHDKRTDAWVDVPQCGVAHHAAPARRPTVVCLNALVPGRQYRVVFSGLHKDDARTKIASFRTPTLASGAGGALRCAVVSADDVYELEYGERSLWLDLRRAVVDEQRVQLVVHLGGQVAMKRMFDKAWALLVRHAECVAPPVSTNEAGENAETTFTNAWAALELEATEILRSAYRTQWTMMEDKAAVLANASNLMIWSDWDIYPAFTTSKVFFVNHEQPTLEMQVLRTVVRCARRLYQEYQRALWDDDLDQVMVRESELGRIAEQALSTTARIFQLGRQIPMAQADLELQKKRREIEGARKAERHLRALEAEKIRFEKTLVSYNQLLAPQAGQEFFYSLGDIGFLFIDMRSARVEPGGSQQAENEVLSNVQWTSIERILEDETFRLLFVCTESPVVDDLPHELRAARGSEGECDFKTWWGSNSSAQQRLIGLLFEWKLQCEGRDAVFVSGSSNTRFAMKTIVRDTRLRTDLVQWMVGPLTARPSGLTIPSRTGILFDRFAYEHSDIEATEKTLLYLDVNAQDSQLISSDPSKKNPRLTVTRVDAAIVQDPARVLVGPVVGNVDAISAMVLLEVDRTCDLVCSVLDQLIGERRRVFQHFESGRPNSFFLNHLRPEHFYEICFERIQDSSLYRCSFTTIARMPSRFQLVAVGSMDSSEQNAAGHAFTEPLPARSVWPWINDNLSTGIPFRGVDRVIHFDDETMLESTDPMKHLVSEGDHKSDLRDIRHVIMDRVREAQRLKWNMPGLRHLLARGSHLMVMKEPNSSAVDDAKQLIVQECVTKVRLEYENLLLPPSKRVSDPGKRIVNPVQFVFGAYGLFVLPEALTKTNASCEDLWSSLDNFLKTPLLTFVTIVSHSPIIEDSVEDVEEKARFDLIYRQTLAFQQEKLARLLRILFTWQQQGKPELRCDRCVVFICGHHKRSFDSILQDLEAHSAIPQPPSIRQFVVGPFKQSYPSTETRSSSLQLNVFPQGTLFGRYGYYHRFYHHPDDKQHEAREEDETGTAELSPESSRSALLHCYITQKPTIDDHNAIEFLPTLVMSDNVSCTSPPSATAFSTGGDLRVQTVGPTSEAPHWSLDTHHPDWLSTVISQPLTEHEEAILTEMKSLLAAKAADIEVSFRRADALAKGLVSSDDCTNLVTNLCLAFEDFHRHGAGMSFRSQYPAVPSAYVINFSLQELVAEDSSAISGAIDLDQYGTILVKSLQNAALFASRLSSFWS